MVTRLSRAAGGGDPSLEEVYGPDLILGDSRNFENSLGGWTASGGVLALVDAAAPTLDGSPSTQYAQFTPDDTGQYIELAIPGTFLAGHQYGLVMIGEGVPGVVELGVIGVDTQEVDIPETFTLGSCVWIPDADCEGVAVRVAGTDEMDEVFLYLVRVAELQDVLTLPGRLFLGGILRVPSIEVATGMSVGGSDVLTQATLPVAANVPVIEAPADAAEEGVNAIIDALVNAGLMEGA